MYVRKVKKANNHVSIRIVESVRVGDKVQQQIVCNLGSAHEDDKAKIDKLISVGEGTILHLKNVKDPALPGLESEVHGKKERKKHDSQEEGLVAISGLKEESRIHRGVDDIFGAMFDQLGLFDSIQHGYKTAESNKLFRQIVLSRVSAPQSKRKSVKTLERDKSLMLDLDKVYRMMDKAFLGEDQIKNKIRQATTSLFKEKVDVAFFDVTTLYFESFIPDDLRRSGFSKDGKFKETQVMLALITTTGGLPLGYELFPGNTYEGNTLLSVIEQVKQTYDLNETFLVADRAMFTKKNLQQLEEVHKVKFIVAAKLRVMKKDEKEAILTEVADALSQDSELKHWVKDYTHEGNRLIVSYCQKRAAKDKRDRERLVERITKKMKGGKVLLADLINNTGTKKYLKIERKGSKEATLNQEKIDRDARWDGIHGVITNQTAEQICSADVLQRYRNLWQIEEAFRVNKHDLKMRPIFHWKPNRIRAHILICFVAFTLVAFVRKKLLDAGLKCSFEETREELQRIQVSVVVDRKTNQRFLLPSKVTEVQRKIYSAFGLKIQETPTFLS